MTSRRSRSLPVPGHPRYERIPQTNPIETRRAPYEPGTDLHESWDIVGEIYADSKSHASVVIEVRPIPPPEGARIGAGDGAGGEVIVYFADSNDASDISKTMIESTIESTIDYVREHWTHRVQGEVDDYYPGGVRDVDYLGYRRVLDDFMSREHVALGRRKGPYRGWASLRPGTIVVVHVPGDRPLITTLNAARLGVAEAEVYDVIYDMAMGRKDYEETNEDAVADFPEAYVMQGQHGAERITQGDWFWIGPHGSGWTQARDSEARQKLLALVEACEQDSEGVKILADLRTEIKHVSVDIWCFSDHDDQKRPDPEKDYVFMNFETEDMIYEEIDEATADAVHNTSEASLARVNEALDRIDIRGPEPDGHSIYVGDVNAHWQFSIDVDSLIEEMYDRYPEELDPDYVEDEDEDT